MTQFADILNAFHTDNLQNFKDLIRESGEIWVEIKTENGSTLLKEAIRLNKKEMFHYLVELVHIDKISANYYETLWYQALWTWENQPNEFDYYASPLINKYTTIPEDYCNLLTLAVQRLSIRGIELLLEKGLNPDAKKSENDPTALFRLLAPYYRDGRHFTAVALLLFYGANPLLKFQNLNAFEFAVLRHRSSDILELLFNYTFCPNERYNINFKVLLFLAKEKSPFFDKIIQINVRFEYVQKLYGHYGPFECEDLFKLQTRYFKYIFQNCYPALHQMFKQCAEWHDPFPYWHDVLYPRLSSVQTLTKLNLLMESSTTMEQPVIHFISSLSGYKVFQHITSKIKKPQATELLIYMMMYGLRVDTQIFDFVYQAFGYCDLFKFLLHMNIPETQDKIHKKI